MKRTLMIFVVLLILHRRQHGGAYAATTSHLLFYICFICNINNILTFVFIQQYSYICFHWFSLVGLNFILLLSILSRADLSQVVECSTICFSPFSSHSWLDSKCCCCNNSGKTTSIVSTSSTTYAFATCSFSIFGFLS